MGKLLSGGRLVTVVVSAAIIGGAVAGCGDSGDDSTDSASAPQGTSTAADAPPAERGDATAPKAGGGSKSKAGEGDSPGGAGTPSQGDQGETGSGGSSDEAPADPEAAAVAGVVEGMYADFGRGDAAGVCAAMSKKVSEQMAQQVPGGSTLPPEQRTCADSLGKFLEVASRAGINQTAMNVRVSKVQVDGDAATATISVAGTSGSVRLVREGGDWRFGAPPKLEPGR